MKINLIRPLLIITALLLTASAGHTRSFAWGDRETFADPTTYGPSATDSIVWREYTALQWAHDSSNGYHDPANGFADRGCARFDLVPGAAMHEDDGGLSEIDFPNSPRVNVGYMVKFGLTFGKWTDAKHILIYDTPHSDGRHTRPMVGMQPARLADVPMYSTLVACTRADGDCSDPNDIAYITDALTSGRPPSFQLQIQPTTFTGWGATYNPVQYENYANRWLYVEFEVVIGGYNTLFIWSESGSLNQNTDETGRHYYARVANDNTAAHPLDYARVMAYHRVYASAQIDAESYACIDNLSVDNAYMGPPAGFVKTALTVSESWIVELPSNTRPIYDLSGIVNDRLVTKSKIGEITVGMPCGAHAAKYSDTAINQDWRIVITADGFVGATVCEKR